MVTYRSRLVVLESLSSSRWSTSFGKFLWCVIWSLSSFCINLGPLQHLRKSLTMLIESLWGSCDVMNWSIIMNTSMLGLLLRNYTWLYVLLLREFTLQMHSLGMFGYFWSSLCAVIWIWSSLIQTWSWKAVAAGVRGCSHVWAHTALQLVRLMQVWPHRRFSWGCYLCMMTQ